MMLFEKYPLEKYIKSLMKQYKYDTDRVTAAVFNRYPFFKRGELKKIISEIKQIVINDDKLKGEWIRVKGKWKLKSVNYNDLSRTKRPQFTEFDFPSGPGKSNTYELMPEDNSPPGDYEEPIDDKTQVYFDKLKMAFKKDLPEVADDELNRIVVNEMISWGFDEDTLKKITSKRIERRKQNG